MFLKTMFQTGLNEHVPVPPEKGFLIHMICDVGGDRFADSRR